MNLSDNFTAEGNCSTAQNFIPISLSLLTKETVSLLEGKVGPIEDLSVTDKTPFEIKLEGRMRTDTIKNFFGRLARFLFGDPREYSRAKNYLILIKKDHDHEGAKQDAEGSKRRRNGKGADLGALTIEATEEIDLHCVLEIRERILKEVADTKTHLWKVLANQMQAKEEATDIVAEKKTAENRMVLQLLARQFLDHDGMSWTQRIAYCETPDDFERLFELLCIPREIWSKVKTFSGFKLASERYSNAQGLLTALKVRFEFHSRFVEFMKHARETEYWRFAFKICFNLASLLEQIEQYEGEDILGELELPDKDAVIAALEAEWDKIRPLDAQAMIHHPWPIVCRSGGRAVDLNADERTIDLDQQRLAITMKIVEQMRKHDGVKRGIWERRFGWCQTSDDWCCFMRAQGVPDERVADKKWLEKNGWASLAFYIQKHFGGKWSAYRALVNVPSQRGRLSKWTRMVRECKKPDDFLELFRRLEILEETWGKPWRISQSKWNGVYYAIIAIEGFKPYSKFLAFLGISTQKPPCTTFKDEIDARSCLDQYLRKHELTPKDLVDPQKLLQLRRDSEFRQFVDYFAQQADAQLEATIIKTEDSSESEEP